MLCRRPDCEEEATDGRWCEPHAAFYARVRRDLEIEAQRQRGRSMVRTRQVVNGVIEHEDDA